MRNLNCRFGRCSVASGISSGIDDPIHAAFLALSNSGGPDSKRTIISSKEGVGDISLKILTIYALY